MKKILLSICLLSFILPVAATDSSETVKYMNQSESFAGFSKTLSNSNRYQEFEKPTKITAEETYDSYLDEFDEDGFRKEQKPVKTEKKVIKTLSDNNGKATVQQDRDIRPMTYDSFPKTLESADFNNSIMMPTSIPGLY